MVPWAVGAKTQGMAMIAKGVHSGMAASLVHAAFRIPVSAMGRMRRSIRGGPKVRMRLLRMPIYRHRCQSVLMPPVLLVGIGVLVCEGAFQCPVRLHVSPGDECAVGAAALPEIDTPDHQGRLICLFPCSACWDSRPRPRTT